MLEVSVNGECTTAVAERSNASVVVGAKERLGLEAEWLWVQAQA